MKNCLKKPKKIKIKFSFYILFFWSRLCGRRISLLTIYLFKLCDTNDFQVKIKYLVDSQETLRFCMNYLCDTAVLYLMKY